MIYIQEAHTKLWPIGLNHPDPQVNFQDRCERARSFVDEEKVPFDFNLYVDTWDNEFSNTYQSWPDRFYLIDDNKRLLASSEYGRDGDEDGKVITDCTEILEWLISQYEANHI